MGRRPSLEHRLCAYMYNCVCQWNVLVHLVFVLQNDWRCVRAIHHHYYQHFIEMQSASIPAGKYCSNYMAEIQALVQVASVVRDSSNEWQQVVFLSDALSVLEATAGDKLPCLAESLHEVAQHKLIVLQWVPAHCVLPGNEKADELAHLGAKGGQQDNSITFQGKKTLIGAALGQRTERGDFHFLDRHSSGAVWESRWLSWAVRHNEPSGFRGRKAILNHASALVSACP